MRTFNPGPSQLSTETEKDLIAAVKKGILSISHRSEQFTQISKNLIMKLRLFMNIPSEYYIFYTTSGTEAMQLIIQNLVEECSFHFVNGSFSGRFKQISASLHKKPISHEVAWGQRQKMKDLVVPQEAELVTVTYNETSTGVMWDGTMLEDLRKRYPQKLLCVDIVSIAGVQNFEVNNADIWFFSVQKCFGLPSGLGIMIVSPQAYEKSVMLKEKQKNFAGHFMFSNMQKKMEGKCQTLQTPNVLDIYLLEKQLDRFLDRGGVPVLENETTEKEKIINSFIERNKHFDYFVKDKNLRSSTVVTIQAEVKVIEGVHAFCQSKGIILGQGYGQLKKTTFRIANFPVHMIEDVQRLVEILQEYSNSLE